MDASGWGRRGTETLTIGNGSVGQDRVERGDLFAFEGEFLGNVLVEFELQSGRFTV